MSYLRLNNTRYNLVGNEKICDGTRLQLYLNAEDFTNDDIKTIFSGLDEIIVYDCITHLTDERVIIETEEFISAIFEGFSRIVAINFDMISNIYEVVLVIPSDIDTRMSDVEASVKTLSEAKSALISAFTENTEPTGVASRYYETGELIAIYDENDNPITVKAVQPISYKHPLIIGLNCEKYLGGNE